MEDNQYKNKIIWPDGPGYFSKTNVESIIREIENDPNKIKEQMNIIIRYPQEVNKNFRL